MSLESETKCDCVNSCYSVICVSSCNFPWRRRNSSRSHSMTSVLYWPLSTHSRTQWYTNGLIATLLRKVRKPSFGRSSGPWIAWAPQRVISSIPNASGTPSYWWTYRNKEIELHTIEQCTTTIHCFCQFYITERVLSNMLPEKMSWSIRTTRRCIGFSIERACKW